MACSSFAEKNCLLRHVGSIALDYAGRLWSDTATGDTGLGLTPSHARGHLSGLSFTSTPNVG